MNKKVVILSAVMAAIILGAGFTTALAVKDDTLLTKNSTLVTIEVNRYLGRQPERIRTTVTAREAEEIRFYLTELYAAQERNDEQAIENYEALLNEKGIFGTNYHHFYSEQSSLSLMKNVQLPVFLSYFAGENISNRLCYFNAIGEGVMLWWLGLAVIQAISAAISNVSNPLGAVILLIILLPIIVLTMLLTDVIPFRIIAPTGAISLVNGSISAVGLMGLQHVKVASEQYGVNLSWFTGLTINIPPINNHKPFLFVSGIALKAEGQYV